MLPTPNRKSFALLIGVVVTYIVTVALVSAEEPKKAPSMREKWNVAIVVHDEVELLDFAGPGEVFARKRGEQAHIVVTLSRDKDGVQRGNHDLVAHRR